MAAGDLTTLTAVKAYLGVATASADDGVLAQLVTAYSAWVKAWLNRDILRTTYTVRLDGTGGDAIMVPQFPIRSVGSLTVDGQPVPAQPTYGQPGYWFTDLAIYRAGGTFTRARGNVQLTYDAGYDTVPFDLAQAVAEIVALRFTNRGDKLGWSSKGLAGETVSLITADLPASARTLLMQYQRVVPV